MKNCKEGVATTTDGWTSLSNDGYLSLTGHGITDEWELTSFCIDILVLAERHTGEYLAEELAKLFDRWDMDKSTIPAIVTDSAANIRKCARILDIPNPPCFGHNLQLGVKAGLEQELVSQVVNEAKQMVTHIHHSSVACTKLKTLAKASGISVTTLKQECPTRWFSSLDMFTSLKALKDPVIIIMIQDKKPVPDDQFWKDLDDLIEVLKPLAAISTRISGESYPTMSFVYPILIDLVSNKLAIKDTDSPMISQFKSAMLDKINIVFDKDDVRELMQIACVLDPRFKHLGFLKRSAQREAYKLLKEKAEIKHAEVKHAEVTPSPSNSPPEKRTRNDEQIDDEDVLIFGSLCLSAMQKDSVKLPKGKTEIDIEIENYKKERGCTSIKDCPLQWWKKHENQFPTLSRLAKRYLAIPATSVKSERLFSDGGNTITKKRQRLAPEFAVELIVLHANRNK